MGNCVFQYHWGKRWRPGERERSGKRCQYPPNFLPRKSHFLTQLITLRPFLIKHQNCGGNSRNKTSEVGNFVSLLFLPYFQGTQGANFTARGFFSAVYFPPPFFVPSPYEEYRDYGPHFIRAGSAPTPKMQMSHKNMYYTPRVPTDLTSSQT